MQELPHHYAVTVAGGAAGDIELNGQRLTTLYSTSPAEFDGPGDKWSPETLLVAAIGDCLILTFRAVASASRLPWISLSCGVTGTLDRVDRVLQFTGFEVDARLDVPTGVDPERARRVLEKAEQSCLISNSVKAPIHLMPRVSIAAQPVGG
jgi:organic hydroperoxide reductase OsmC/OhrA